MSRLFLSMMDEMDVRSKAFVMRLLRWSRFKAVFEFAQTGLHP